MTKLTAQQIKQIEKLFGLQFREETDSFYRWFSNGQDLYIQKRFLDRGYLDAYVKNGNQLMGIPIELIEQLGKILTGEKNE